MSGRIQIIQFAVAMAAEVGVVALHLRNPKSFTSFATSVLASLPLLVLNFTLGSRSFSTKGVSGKKQSPVDIVTDDVVTDPTVRGLTIHYTPDNHAKLKNTGSSAKIQISSLCDVYQEGSPTLKIAQYVHVSAAPPPGGIESTFTFNIRTETTKRREEIKGGPLQATYTLEQFHFHWGKEEGRGGEHTVNGKAFDAELHFVHYNKSKYGSFEKAADKEDGLAVLGVLIKVGQEHRGMSQLTSLLGDVITSGSSRKVSVPLDIRDLLPDKLDEYYTYPGSLTTPGYFESVRWIVLKDIMEISRQQIEAFRSLCDENGAKIGDNFRETHPLCERCIKRTFY